MVDVAGRRTVLRLGGALVCAGVSGAWPRPAGAASVRDRNDALFASIRADTRTGGPQWKWIVVHHTAAESASLEGIDRYHRNHFGSPDGAEYHFVVNNGRKRPMGLVEAARWRYNNLGAHLFHPERAPDSLAICVIGNFETRKFPGVMLRELTFLTRVLMDKFAIPPERVSTHRGVDGRLTQCPGKHFPTKRFLARLRTATPPSPSPAPGAATTGG